MHYLGFIFLIIGLFLNLSAIIGFKRFRTFFDQFHAIGIIDSIGSTLVIIGLLIVAEAPYMILIKSFIFLILLWIISPFNTYLLANIARKHIKEH